MMITMENTYETLEELYVEGLFEENFLEADPRSLSSHFTLNLASCYNLLDANMMKIIVARDEGKPVGYLIYNLVPQDLFTMQTVASTMCVYIKMEYRGGLLFNKLIKFAEESARLEGACVFHIGLTPNSVNLERFGYHTDNIVFSKTLEV